VRPYVSKRPFAAPVNTYPDTLHVECNTVGRDAFVVSGFENVVLPSLVCEATTQPIDVGLECVRSEKFVGESREREVEVVSQSAIPEFRGLRNGVPNPLHVGGERGDEVLHWSGAKVITNDEK
jgi:hypothetical protein